MFFGEYRHSLDTKGRLIIPARVREGLGDRFIITRGLDQCLFVFPPAELKEIERKLKGAPSTTSKDSRFFMRMLFSGAGEVEPDKQGRILIPQNLREFSRLEKEAVIIGVSNRVEIWAEEVWDDYTGKEDISFEQVAENLVDFGL